MNVITQSINEDGKRVMITVRGRFDFGLHKDFRSAYQDTTGLGTEYCVDLQKADYLDSSALGMLLLLREYAGGDQAQVIIHAASESVRKVLEVANFHKLFVLE